jgi:hypothetical protein
MQNQISEPKLYQPVKTSPTSRPSDLQTLRPSDFRPLYIKPHNMPKKYFKTPDNKLIFQYTASLIVLIKGKIQTKETDVVITIHPTIKGNKDCFKASIINASFINGNPFTKEWLSDLKANNYGLDLTESTNGPVVYYYNQEQLLEAVIQSLTNDTRLTTHL